MSESNDKSEIFNSGKRKHEVGRAQTQIVKMINIGQPNKTLSSDSESMSFEDNISFDSKGGEKMEHN